MKDCSEGEHNKFVGIGATIFFTATMSFVASTYALFPLFGNAFFALLFGIIWSLLIFNLDRFIVSTIRKKNDFKSEFLQALPRFLLAGIIAVVISKPLEIKLFEKEIKDILIQDEKNYFLENKKEVTAYYQSDFDKYTTEKNRLQTEINNKEKEVKTYYQSFINELEGTKGTMKAGRGSAYRDKKAQYKFATSELESIKAINLKRIDELNQKLNLLQADVDTTAKNTEGFVAKLNGSKIDALGKLPWLPGLILMVLFLAIETSPILAKLISPRGEYDYKLDDAEQTIKSKLLKEKQQRELLEKTTSKIYTKITEDISQDEDLYKSQLEKATTLVEWQLKNFTKGQKTKNKSKKKKKDRDDLRIKVIK